IILSQSRAGTLSFLVEMALLLKLLGSEMKPRTAAAIGTVCFVAAAFAAWVGPHASWHHFASLQDGMRLAIIQDSLLMFLHKPVLGWGLGTFTTVYPQFRSFYTDLFVNAAHNDYLQILVETGILGFISFSWFLMVVYRYGLRNQEFWSRS